MKTSKFFILLLSILLIGCTTEHLEEIKVGLDKTRYVSADGDDSNSGKTPNDPWRTTTHVNNSILPIDAIILFRSGDTFKGVLEIDTPTSIGSYGLRKAILGGIKVTNTSNVHIDRIQVTGTSNEGILIQNTLSGDTKFNNIKITNTDVSGFKNYGIRLLGYNDTSGYNDVLIEDVRVSEILYAGIASEGFYDYQKVGYSHSNIIVRRAEVFNIYGDKNRTDSHSGNGIVLADVQNSIIEYSKVYNSAQNNNWNGGGAVGIWYWDSDSVIIQHNEVYGMGSGLTNKDGAGFDLDGGVTNGIMQYNYSHDNEGGGYIIGQFPWARPMRNITVRWNISQNDAIRYSSSIFLFNEHKEMVNINIHNNTIINPNKAVFSTYTWNGGTFVNLNVQNNTLYGIGTIGFNNINYYKENPNIDNFKLRAGSPLIDAGIYFSFDIGNSNYFGNRKKLYYLKKE